MVSLYVCDSVLYFFFFFFKQKTAYEMRISDWSSDVCSSDLIAALYAEDGAVMPPNAPIGKGRTAIQQTWASMMQTPGFDLAIVPEQIAVSSSGDMAQIGRA